jgi:hypothetical protein
MSRANVILLIFAASLASGANALASGNSSGNLPTPVQSTNDNEATQGQTDMAMVVPLLVYVDGRGQVRSIQHSQRLLSDVNNLLWQSVKSWTKSPAVINGRRAAAQVVMNVILHAQPQPDGKTNVYFTFASEGPILRGYWIMRRGNRLNGYCSPTGDMSGGNGGARRWCYAELLPVSASSTAKATVQ